MAKTVEKSSWETETGLLDDYDFVVEEAWFGLDEESDNPDERIFLFLRGTAVDEDGEEYDDHTERYSTGKSWEVVEDGTAVEKATGKNNFNKNAGLGRLIDTLVGLGDAEAEYLASRGQAYEASTFEGLEMHMLGREVSKWKDDETDEWHVWNLNLPDELTVPKPKSRSKGGKGKGGKGKASRSGTKNPKGKSKGSGLRAEIVEFAKEFEDDEHDEFVEQVLDSEVFDNADKIDDDDELHAEVLNPESDLWGEAH